MKTIRAITKQDFALFICAVLLVALIYSKFALSVCMISLVVISIFNFDPARKLPVFLNPLLGENLKRCYQNRSFLVVFLFFCLVLFSGIYSDDVNFWTERLRIKLPFLLLPFAFVSIPAFSKRQFQGLFYFLLLLMLFSTSMVGIHYWQHYEAINALLEKGQPMPTPMSHIRYSLLLAYATVAGFILFGQRFHLKYAWEPYLVLAISLFLFFFLHVLSVRSGLMVLYVCLFSLGLRYLYRSRNYRLVLAGLVLLGSLPFIAYQTMDSFKTRIDYARYDLKMYLEGNGQAYSDGDRWTSLKIGMEIAQANPLLGVGAGDLRQAVKERYQANYPAVKDYKMPHSQFVSVLAGTGIIGLLVFLLAFFYPLFARKHYQNDLFFALHLIVLLSFLVENTIENAIGVAFYVFFLLLGLNFLEGQVENKKIGTSK